MDGRSFRPASADDGKDSARRIGAGGTWWHFQFRNVLRFLRVQCPGIRLRRAAAEPGTALPLLREIQGRGDGNRLSGNWTGWCRVTVDLASAGAAIRMASRVEAAGRFDRGSRISPGPLSVRCARAALDFTDHNFAFRSSGGI